MPVSVVVNSDKAYSVVADHLNTPRRIAGPDGALVWQWGYSASGDEAPTTAACKFASVAAVDGDLEFNLRYPGQYFDRESNLHYNGFRTYNPTTGRYTQGDPIGLQGGWNRFGYVSANPLSFVDFLGLEAGVTVWQPSGWGSSSFGHVSTNINGTAYSFGPQGMSKMPTADYTAKNDFSSGMELTLKLGPKQEATLAACLSKPQGKYNTIANNCGSPVQNCLQELGINTGSQLLPVNLGNKMIDMGITSGAKEYPQSRPATGSSAPWAI